MLIHPIDAKRRRIDGRIESESFVLVENDGRPVGEVLVEQPALLGKPEIILCIQLIRTRTPRVFVPSVIAPAGRLGDDGEVDFIGAIDPSLSSHLRCQGACVKEMFVETIAESHAKFLNVVQVVEQSRRILRSSRGALVDSFEYAL